MNDIMLIKNKSNKPIGLLAFDRRYILKHYWNKDGYTNKDYNHTIILNNRNELYYEWNKVSKLCQLIRSKSELL